MAASICTYRFRGDQDYEDDSGVIIGGDLDALVNNKIYFSNLRQLNDPFEHASLEFPGASLKMFGVVCLCRSVTNPLLWSHYANSHRGFAIGYNRDHEFFEKLQIVVYEDYPPDDPGMLVKRRLATKPTCWAYEQEDRLIRGTLAGKLKDIPPEAVKEVVFGLQMEVSRVDVICKALKGRGIRLGKMNACKGQYGVKIDWM